MERQSVRGIVKKDNEVILIHRIKNGEEYWVVPGGGIEKGETPEEALGRELEEELGIKVKLIKEVAKIQNKIAGKEVTEIFYECKFVSGEVGSGEGEEFTVRNSADNSYRVEGVTAKIAKEINIKPIEIKNIIVSILE